MSAAKDDCYYYVSELYQSKAELCAQNVVCSKLLKEHMHNIQPGIFKASSHHATLYSINIEKQVCMIF